MKQFVTSMCLVAACMGTLSAQTMPPQLFSGMQGFTFLPDGTPIPIWGYGWVSDGFITLPAPLLTYEEGEDVQLNFTNPSPESHTIHLHGLDVDQANDGVPGTSFLVTTGGQTTYSFSANYPGTFLYHCHVTTTLHLTMGMYGMVLVTRPDQTLFEGGPAYAEDVPLLFSDLEVATNLDPVGSFPFHDIRPDVFMVNGVSGSQLEAADRIIHYEPGQPVALRLGSMAYSRMELIFPAELNATCFMSDGRPVPSPFSVETLNIYPGERFTVLIEPDANWDGHITCNYWSMVDETLEGSNGLHVRDAALHISETEKMAIKGWPNPAHSHIQWSDGSALSVWDTFGRLVCVTDLQNGILTVDGWEPGTYIARFEDGRTARFVVSE